MNGLLRYATGHLISALVLVLLVFVLVLLILLVLLVLLVIHNSFLHLSVLRTRRMSSVPQLSGFILRLENQTDQ